MTAVPSRPAVVVVVPAHDEGAMICRTVHALTAAIRQARRRRVVGEVSLEVAAHRCADDTAARARSCLQLVRWAEVVEDNDSATIGQVRDLGARRGLARVTTDPNQSWVLSTDADTLVPRGWVEELLGHATRHAATAVVGLAELDRFRGTPSARAAYQALLDAGMRDVDDLHQHDHVYGANLAIRADAYLEAGGFADVPHGEDRQLVETLVARGARVLRTRDVSVTTSGRLEGRAADGLATLLRTLDQPHQPDQHAQQSGSTPPTAGVSPRETWARDVVPVNSPMLVPTVRG